MNGPAGGDTQDMAGRVTSVDVASFTAGDTTFEGTSFDQLKEINRISALRGMGLPQSSQEQGGP
jgi:hypothetical protein